MPRPKSALNTYGTINVAWVPKDAEKPEGPGKWRARSRYRFDDGKVRQVERWDSSEPKARAALRAAMARIEVPSDSDIQRTTRIRVLAEKFLESKRSSGAVTARTLDTYEWAIEAVIVPGIGELSVQECTTERIDRFLTKVVKERGRGVAKTCRSVLSGMLGLAIRSGAATVNTTRDVTPISRKNEGATAITADSMASILAAVRKSEELQALDMVDLVDFLAGTGLRISEALALQWEQIDIDGSTVSVIKNVVRAKGQGLILQPHTKTQAGMRMISVPNHVVAVLERRKGDVAPTDLVFPSQLGMLRDPNNTMRDWRNLRESVGAPDATFHSFRKYVATTLDGAGLSARDIAEYLGHSRPSLTQDVYMSRKVGGSKAAVALDLALKHPA